jgi:hypothetical protein
VNIRYDEHNKALRAAFNHELSAVKDSKKGIYKNFRQRRPGGVFGEFGPEMMARTPCLISGIICAARRGK